MRRLVPCALFAVAVTGCFCQRPENIAAKERLTKPQPKEDVSAKASEVIDVETLTDPAKMKRVAHMDGAEIAARLKSYVLESEGALSFARAATPDAGVRSSERTKLVQSDTGDFSISTVTGDGSEMNLTYTNEVFFLKNNNGKWRVSRDPSGERNRYRDDALAVWSSFYDLVAHALVVERIGATTVDGRSALAFGLKLPDRKQEAIEAGKLVTDEAPPPIPGDGPDAGTLPGEDEETRKKRIAQRVSKWAQRSKPAGGSGKFVVDEATGVPLLIEFDGALVVGDGKDPAKLTVHIKRKISEIGRPQEVAAPEGAIQEIVRKKMPVEPRTILEDANVVPPLPRDAGPGGGGRGSRGTPVPAGLPDDDEG